MKNYIILLFVVASLLFITACSNSSDVVKEDTEPVEEPVQELEEVEEVEEIIDIDTYPLTGRPVTEEISRRVVGVVVNNHPAARPQSGLLEADIVYEVLAEYDVTRFVALFHSQTPERVGPVRSARPYQIDLVNGYNGLFVAHGWSPEAKQQLKNGKADYLNGLFHDGTLFERSRDRKAPHNSYISFDHMIEGLESKGYELSGDVPSFLFSEDETISPLGTEAKEINIVYGKNNSVQYVFNEDTGYYERFNGSDQTIDYETNAPIEISNVFVVEANHTGA